MTRHKKLQQRLIENPESVSFQEIKTTLIRLGFEHIHTRGSHQKFRHLDLGTDITIPVHNGECKISYKKEVVKILKINKLI